MNIKTAETNYFSTHQLKERGWTVGLIKRFLPEHDEERPNQMKMGRRRLPPVKLYSQDRVHQIEREDEFLAAQAKAADAKARAERASKTRRAKREQAVARAIEAFTPPIEVLRLRKGAVRKAREPYQVLIEQTTQNIVLELKLNKIETTKVHQLLSERLDVLLAHTYDWYPLPQEQEIKKAQKKAKRQKSPPTEEAKPSDWREWDWD